MPAFRIGFSSDFTLRNQLVGVGTTSAVRRLNVIGATKGDFEILGVSTLSVYEGFVPEFQNVSFASTIGFSTSGVGTFVQVTESETGYLSLTTEFNSVSEDIVVDEGRIFEVSIGSTATLGSLESISVQSHFSVPNGGTSTRSADPVEGMVRFNDDLNTLEFWNGFEWRQFTVTGASGRGVFGGGNPGPSYTSTIEFINIQTTGNTQDFGTLSQTRTPSGSGSSSIRGIFAGGYTPGASPNLSNVIDYITIASQGNAIDFGDIATTTRRSLTGCSSSTRCLFAGGETPTVQNVIDYIQISTLGNSVDFGDLSITRNQPSGCSSPTRGIFAGGEGPLNSMDFVTIASTGNAVKFGELTQASNNQGACSNTTRALISGGYAGASGRTNRIEYITIASIGNGTDFGDLTVRRDNVGTEVASQTRAVFGAGYSTSGNVNVMDYVTIATIGDAQDFGDMVSNATSRGRCSDSHGGLGGF